MTFRPPIITRLWPKDTGAGLRGASDIPPNVLLLDLTGKDQFFGGPGQPPANLDWPVPRGYLQPIDLRSWVQNLSQSTLAPALPAQPAPITDFPNPRGYIYSVGLRTHLSDIVQLIGQDQFFDGPGRAPVYDYPNPRGYTPGIALRTHIDPLKIDLLGQDKFFGGPGQAPANLDWPVPKGPRYLVTLRHWSQDPQTLKPFIQPPFYQTEWPNPRGYTPGVSLKFFYDPALPTQPTTWITVTPASGGGWITVSAVTGLWTTVPIKT